MLVVVGLAVGGGIYWNRHSLRAASSSDYALPETSKSPDVEVSFRTPGWWRRVSCPRATFVEAGAAVARLDPRI